MNTIWWGLVVGFTIVPFLDVSQDEGEGTAYCFLEVSSGNKKSFFVFLCFMFFWVQMKRKSTLYLRQISVLCV